MKKAIGMFLAMIFAGTLTTSSMASASYVVLADEPYFIAEIHSEYDEPAVIMPVVEEEHQQDEVYVPGSGFIYLEEIPLTADQQRLIYDLWTDAGYDYAMALALADKETGGTFNISAVNHNTHDYGLFQLNRASWCKTFKKMFGISSMDDMLDLQLNIQGALYVYGDCVDRYGETEKAIVAYNMGFAKYNSTKYSRDVMSKYEKWNARLG